MSYLRQSRTRPSCACWRSLVAKAAEALRECLGACTAKIDQRFGEDLVVPIEKRRRPVERPVGDFDFWP